VKIKPNRRKSMNILENPWKRWKSNKINENRRKSM